MNIRQRGMMMLNTNFFDAMALPNAAEEVCAVDFNIQPPAERQYILRMCVKSPTSELEIPDELDWLRETILETMQHQHGVIRIKHQFMYVTVRHGVCDSVTDDVWHVDGFSLSVNHIPEQNYVFTLGAHATEWVNQKFVIPNGFDADKHNIHPLLARQVRPENVQQMKPNMVYCMDPYIVHRRPPEATGQQRTFVRISYVPIEINDTNNTQNPLLPRVYDRDGIADFRNKLVEYQA